MQTDPIGYEDGMNWYAYVGNDPVNGIDPTGNNVVLRYATPILKNPSKIGKTAARIAKSIGQNIGIVSATSNENSDPLGSGVNQDVPDSSDWTYDSESDSMVQNPSSSGGDPENNNNNNDNKKKYNKKTFHKKNASKSNKNKHQQGETRVKKDQGGEKKDSEMPYRRK